jgi:hypothetical protein
MDAQNQDRLDGNLSRFAILWHALPSPPVGSLHSSRSSHFDFLFENSGHLVTFEMPRMPIPGERLRLIRLGNHRVDYLQLEGKLGPGLQGENRGYVTRWAAGTFHCLRRTPAKRIIELTSERFSAQIVLMPKPKMERLPLEALGIPNSTQAETRLVLPGSNALSNPSAPALGTQGFQTKLTSSSYDDLPPSPIEVLLSNDLWPDVETWEMYVSRWALKEKNV